MVDEDDRIDTLAEIDEAERHHEDGTLNFDDEAEVRRQECDDEARHIMGE